MAASQREWTVGGGGTAEKLDLYLAVSGAMRQGARKGLRTMLGYQPLEHDVEDVIIVAFERLWAEDLTGVEHPDRLGYRYAYRRGQDHARRILREHKEARPTAVIRAGEELHDETVDEVHYATRATLLIKCKEHLTDDQRAVIAATVEGIFGQKPMKLTDWARSDAYAGKKTYQAWHRQRERGFDSLRKCIERHEANGGVDGGR